MRQDVALCSVTCQNAWCHNRKGINVNILRLKKMMWSGVWRSGLETAKLPNRYCGLQIVFEPRDLPIGM